MIVLSIMNTCSSMKFHLRPVNEARNDENDEQDSQGRRRSSPRVICSYRAAIASRLLRFHLIWIATDVDNLFVLKSFIAEQTRLMRSAMTLVNRFCLNPRDRPIFFNLFFRFASILRIALSDTFCIADDAFFFLS